MNSPAPLQIKNLSCTYPGGDQNALQNINIKIENGKITGILGPNGAGKSTLIKAALGLLKHEGECKFFNDRFENTRRRVAYIPQRSTIDWDFPISALDVCIMGLYPRIGLFRRISKKHKAEAMNYLETLELEDLANRPIGALSGGQQQRVFMARALAQKADLFLLDEPMAAVDQKTQDMLFTLLKDQANKGKTCVIVHHNLSDAQKHFDNAILLNKILVAQGTCGETLNEDNLRRAYGAIAI